MLLISVTLAEILDNHLLSSTLQGTMVTWALNYLMHMPQTLYTHVLTTWLSASHSLFFSFKPFNFCCCCCHNSWALSFLRMASLLKQQTDKAFMKYNNNHQICFFNHFHTVNTRTCVFH